jgi:dihydrofolate synthase/folylpolyglutamate synthase
MVLGLERVAAGAAALGDPHLDVPIIHVAGTNGKGSVSAMIESVLRVAGRRTGLYTSPHLSRFAERIQLGGAPIGDDAFAEALGRVLVDAPDDLTFFETLTLGAFVAFRDARLDVAVLEVGLGGRLDATNLVPAPLATAIVSIAWGEGGAHLEHANLLGNTVPEIAREKAGIAKPGVPLVLGPLAPDARAAVLEIAHTVGADPVVEVGDGALDPNGAVRLSLEARRLALPGATLALEPNLAGRHQLWNAAVAATTCWAARGLALSPSVIEAGLRAASWPARLERIEHCGRVFVLDAAHNVDGARALVDAWTTTSLGAPPDRTVLVFGALADKAFEPMLRALAPLADRRVYGLPEGRAPAPISALQSIAPGVAAETAEAVVARALELASADDVVLVAGSIYLVGAVRARLLGIEPDPVVAL